MLKNPGKLALAASLGAMLLVGFGCGPKPAPVTTNAPRPAPAPAPAAPKPARQLEVDLSAQGSAGLSGKAVLIEQNDKTKVMFNLNGNGAGPLPAHIHLGSCPTPGEVKYSLTSASVEGNSTTLIDASFDEILAQMPLAINVHKSATELGVYLSCGDLVASKVMNMEAGIEAKIMAEPSVSADEQQGVITLNPIGANGVSGTATIKAEDGKTMVGILLTGSHTLTHPAHLHLGKCPASGAVTFPLTSVVDGKSSTALSTSLEQVMVAGSASLNVHVSPTDPTVIACGDLPAWNASLKQFVK